MNRCHLLIGQELRLTPGEETQLNECLDHYSWEWQGIGHFLSTLVYRVWNAIKHIFDCSDWQQCDALLKSKFTSYRNLDFTLQVLEECPRLPVIVLLLESMRVEFQKFKKDNTYTDFINNSVDTQKGKDHVVAVAASIRREYKLFQLQLRAQHLLFESHVRREALQKLHQEKEPMESSIRKWTASNPEIAKTIQQDIQARLAPYERGDVIRLLNKVDGFTSLLMSVMCALKNQDLKPVNYRDVDQIAHN